MQVIDFDRLERDVSVLSESFRNARPYGHVVIDGFCEEASLRKLLTEIPDPEAAQIGKSRDYIFAKNKYEKSRFEQHGEALAVFKQELLSDRFQKFLSRLTGEDLFVDPSFHGGGIHQGGAGSFLDMHVDFDRHPIQSEWIRRLNILLYLNEQWQPEFGGELKLKHVAKQDEPPVKIQPIVNRAVIMVTDDTSLHGYSKINFPAGMYRRSIASYAYRHATEADVSKGRTTVWYPESGGAVKRILGRHFHKLVKLKHRLFKSGTAENQ